MIKLNQEYNIVANFLADDEMSDKKAEKFAEELELVMNLYKVYRIDATLSPYSKRLIMKQ